MDRKKKILCALALLFVFGCGIITGYLTYTPVRNVYHSLRREYEDKKNRGKNLKEQQLVFETEIGEGKKEIITFLNGEKASDVSKAGEGDDVRQIIRAGSADYYVSYPEGYMVRLPKESELDFTLGNLFTKAASAGNGMEVTFSKEYSPYDEIDEYFDFYLNRFALSEKFREENRITLLEFEENALYAGFGTNLISVRVEDYEGLNVYTYALIKTGGRTFYRMMFKYGDFEGQRGEIEEILHSFKTGKLIGTAKTAQGQFSPAGAPFWDDSAKQLYEQFKKPGGKVKWGFYTGRMDTYGIDEKVPEIEAAIDYEFDLLMIYFDLGMLPPVEFMRKAADMGKMVELTMHVTANSNTDVYAYTPMLDLYRGELDDVVRDAARKLKDIQMPFILRLNNEMNSDWTNYSGVVNLSDPDIYKDVWRRIYRIFEEEGVHNAIWAFNPNDRNYPPCNWNNYVAYFPGEDYVQMIGVTGYNTGDYYADVFGETWREFKDIYDHVQAEYSQYFEAYPWIITEFATSSHGGDKPGWILDMFAHIDDYENIKMAVWYSNPDMDFRPEYKGKIARPYMLDETQASIEAFRQGLKEYLAK